MEKNKKLIISSRVLIGMGIVILLLIQSCFEYYGGLMLLIFDFNGDFIRLILTLTLMFLPILKIKPSKDKVERIARAAYTIVAIIVAMILLFFYMLLFSEKEYFYFHNPDKTRTLVAEETSFLLSGETNFYERKHGIFIKYTGKSIGTDDGYRPFSNNQYEIVWQDSSTACINYDFGSAGIWKKEIVKLK